ncbi:MAG: ABC transporter permease [Microvirga sp.]
MSLLRAELLKARTTRLLLWYGLGLVAFLVLVVSIHLGTSNPFDLGRASNQRDLFAVSGLAAVTAVLVGAVLLTSEYAHGTINQSFLATPVRQRLLTAKVVVAALIGGGLGLLAAVTVLVLGELWYAGRGVTLHLGHGTLTPALGAIAASALAAVVGLGLGGIIRRQTATIVIILLWLLIGENVISVTDSARYAPGHVFGAIVAAHAHGTSDTLAVWSAAAAALVYGAIFAAAGLIAIATSDVPSQAG